MIRQPYNLLDALQGNPRMTVAIQPFEQVQGGYSWDGEAVAYVWGEAAIALGRHWDGYEDSEAWEEEIDRLEAELVAHAEQVMGGMFRVKIAPEYI